jgi:imidazolonepropionase-like amidohydrolase/Tol biopolymer transport system component
MPVRADARLAFALFGLLARSAASAAAPEPPGGEPASGAEKPAGAESAAPSWDVNDPPGEESEVAIDTTTGTWISLDVAPDGRELVFDLLGDLYLLPIEGGEARAISSGMAWDEQPTFSPDGRWIAFTSDRGGGDNLWIAKRDGSAPQPVTKEEFRLVNSPAFSPDGDYLAGRKHFTSERSAGAGEVWLWHRAGGEGVELTKRPNDQKDLGEPSFSPDGRYLYFSQDATPGEIFEYNKDSNGQVYVVKRYDRSTGAIEVVVDGPGGAIRPTPAPDGQRLAYVRRVRGRSVLHVMDLASRRERALFDGLDRDLQEAWAIHGVYPRFDWTPDGASLVVWAGGKIVRVDAASGAVREIPFRVRGTRQVSTALRFPQAVAPGSFRARMLRWVRVAPDGKRAVYQALGHLYLRDLPAGTPRRLTRQREEFEYMPSFSRDGKWIVYVAFDDQKLGAVKVAPAAGGEGRALTAEPGHYFDPAFTPDGKFVVYRKERGSWLRGRLWGAEPGVYAVPAAGGAPRLVTRDGYAPQFGAGSDRVFLVRFADEDRRQLVAIELDGSDERVVANSEAATEIAVSPDERWLAFVERWNAHVAPFPATGKPLEIGPKMANLPVARVSRDAGENLQFSGDAKALHWSLGPELFTRPLADAFAFLRPEAGGPAPEKLPEPAGAGSGLDLSFDVPAAKPKSVYALLGARIVTLRGEEVIEDGALLVDGNRIAAVGRRGEVAVPPGAVVLDLAGKTIVPGLVDVHWHGEMGSNQIVPEQSWVLYASLAYGVTTLHDPSNDTREVFAAAELERAGAIVAPRIFSTGTILYGAKADVKAIVDSLDDARTHLRRLQAAGAFSVKSYNQPRRNQRQQIVAAARELRMMVVPEGGSLLPANLTHVVDGHTGVEHCLPQGAIYDDVVQLWRGTRVGYTPTLGVAYGGLTGETYWYAKTNVWEDTRLATFVPRPLVDAASRRRPIAPEEEWGHLHAARVAKRLADAGVSVQLGAHGQREGLAAHWELWSFVQGGMTPHAALRAGTLDGARYLGLDGDLGSLEPGKLADLAILDANPLENIRFSTSVAMVMANGRLFDARTMDAIGAEPRKRAPFWWEPPAD